MIFLSAPKAPPPQKAKSLLYCLLWGEAKVPPFLGSEARDSENGQIHGPLNSDTPLAPSDLVSC